MFNEEQMSCGKKSSAFPRTIAICHYMAFPSAATLSTVSEQRSIEINDS